MANHSGAPAAGRPPAVPLREQAELDALAARQLRVSAVLTALILVIYFGFILLIAFAKETLGQILVPGLSLGILLGVVVIVATWILTWVYVGWANRRYEPAVRRLRR